MRATVSHPRSTISGFRLAARFINGVSSRGSNASMDGLDAALALERVRAA